MFRSRYGTNPECQKRALEWSIAHEHVTFVETDFNQETWMEALLDSGFNPSLTTYILWEGVTMYLVEEAVRDTLNLIATLPAGVPLEWISFLGILSKAIHPMKS